MVANSTTGESMLCAEPDQMKGSDTVKVIGDY